MGDMLSQQIEVETAKNVVSKYIKQQTQRNHELEDLRKRATQAHTFWKPRSPPRAGAWTMYISNQARVLEIAEEIGGLKNELKHLKKSEKTAQDALKESKEQFEKWKLEFPCRTKQQLMQHGTDVIAPAAAYYNNLFHSPDGRHYNMRIMAEAAKIFNPIILSECSDGDGKSLRLKAKRDVDVNSHIVQLTRTCQDLLTS